MAQTVTPGTPLQITLASGGYFNLTVPDKATAQVTRTGPDGGQVNESIAGGPVTTKIGPHIRQMSYTVTAVGAACSVDAVDGNTDLRPLANWFRGGYAGKSVCFWGDSTTFQMSGGYVNSDGTWQYSLAPDLAAANVKIFNRGANGAALSAVIAGSVVGVDGLDCGVDAVSALKCDVYVVCFAINDCRTDPSIVGSYGNAGQIAKAQALQALFAAAVSKITAKNPNAAIVWRMPNAHVTGTALITSPTTAQHCMDTYRLTFRGDSALGVPAITAIAPSRSMMYDTLARWYDDTAYAAAPTNARLDVDKLHPAGAWYGNLLYDMGGVLSTPLASSISSALVAAQVAATAVDRVGLSIRPKNAALSSDYVPIASCTSGTPGGSYCDVAPVFEGQQATASTTKAWGAASGAAFGTAAVPALSVDDIIVWSPIGLPQIVMPIRRMADANQGGALRWFSGGPDGYYPTAGQLPAGSFGVIYRRKDSGSWDAQQYFRALTKYGAVAPLANAYPFMVVAASTGSLEIRGMAPLAGLKSLAGKTITTSEKLILAGVTPADGLLLTGASWAAGADPGRGTITLSGVEFDKYAIRQGLILSST